MEGDLAGIVGHKRLATVIVLLVATTTLAGCLSDLQRDRLDVGWDPEVTLWEGPVEEVDGWQAMLVATGTVTVPAGETVEITGISASLDHGNGTLEMSANRLVVGDQAVRPDQIDQQVLELTDGETVRASFAPAPGGRLSLAAGEPVNVSTEIQWRFRQGDRFDAGKLEVSRNATVAAGPGFGVGRAIVEDGEITSLVFEAVGQPVPTGTSGVAVYAFRADGNERLGPTQATFEGGEGVVLARLDRAMDAPDPEGYLVFRLDEGPVPGVAILDLGQGEDQVPWPGIGWLLVTIGGLAAMARPGRPGRG